MIILNYFKKAKLYEPEQRDVNMRMFLKIIFKEHFHD